MRPPRSVFPIPKARPLPPGSQKRTGHPAQEREEPDEWKLNAPEALAEEAVKFAQTAAVSPAPSLFDPANVPGTGSTAPATEAYAIATAPSKSAEIRTSLTLLLGSSSGARAAMVLREILGAPRGLQPLEEMSGIA